MVELIARRMTEPDLMKGLREEVTTLQGLLAYLEERDELGAKEFLLCQVRLHDAIKALKRLERISAEGRG